MTKKVLKGILCRDTLRKEQDKLFNSYASFLKILSLPSVQVFRKLHMHSVYDLLISNSRFMNIFMSFWGVSKEKGGV